MFSVFNRRANPRFPILSYHGLNAPGETYGTNDHVALAEDLAVIRSSGFRVVPVRRIVNAVIGIETAPSGNCVGITFDDGTNFDYRDVQRTGANLLKSLARILREPVPRPRRGGVHWPRPTAVSFVIASPEARKVLDQTCIAGLDDWTDDWWREAHRGGVLQIGNHSWDHTHPTLPTVAQRNQATDTFQYIDTWDDADRQIRQAEDYIESVLGGPSARIFAVPYGDPVPYLYLEYFPKYERYHRQLACFETGGDYVTLDSNRWRLPRFMCGQDWKSPEELAHILEGAKVASV